MTVRFVFMFFIVYITPHFYQIPDSHFPILSQIMQITFRQFQIVFHFLLRPGRKNIIFRLDDPSGGPVGQMFSLLRETDSFVFGIHGLQINSALRFQLAQSRIDSLLTYTKLMINIPKQARIPRSQIA